ncbi:MAG TPA: cysteine-rich CWC family protein [Casimicrobiaceae bacterium]|nr:cysteine-rich CWC family protein [Casimicrobiaceae bacterium]
MTNSLSSGREGAVATGYDPSHCPRCGGVNACAMAAGDPRPCWCTQVVVPAALLDGLPAGAKGVACLCAACIAMAASQGDATPG